MQKRGVGKYRAHKHYYRKCRNAPNIKYSEIRAEYCPQNNAAQYHSVACYGLAAVSPYKPRRHNRVQHKGKCGDTTPEKRLF